MRASGEKTSQTDTSIGKWQALLLFETCPHCFSLHTVTYQQTTTQYRGGPLPHQLQLGQYVTSNSQASISLHLNSI